MATKRRQGPKGRGTAEGAGQLAAAAAAAAAEQPSARGARKPGGRGKRGRARSSDLEVPGRASPPQSPPPSAAAAPRPTPLPSSPNKRRKGFHGCPCPSCGTLNGFNSKRCKGCGAFVRGAYSRRAREAAPAAPLAVAAGPAGVRRKGETDSPKGVAMRELHVGRRRADGAPQLSLGKRRTASVGQAKGADGAAGGRGKQARRRTRSMNELRGAGARAAVKEEEGGCGKCAAGGCAADDAALSLYDAVDEARMAARIVRAKLIVNLARQSPTKGRAALNADQIARRITSFLPMARGVGHRQSSLSPLEGADAGHLRAHLTSLRLETIQRTLRPLLSRLILHPSNRGMFNVPVDAVALGLPDYDRIVRCPMDLGTIKMRLQALQYEKIEAFGDDVRLVFRNAMRYNPPKNHVHQSAKAMLADFDAEFRKVIAKVDREAARREGHECPHCQGQTCELCGEKCLKFEPAVLVCQGACNQRIKRGSQYYITQDGARLWCQRCYGSLPTIIPSDHLGDGAAEGAAPAGPQPRGKAIIAAGVSLGADGKGMILKRSLLKRRFDEEVSEPWVQCDACEKWVHQICALFNPKSNAIDSNTKFLCPTCKLRRHSMAGETAAARGAAADNAGPPPAIALDDLSASPQASPMSDTSSECSTDGSEHQLGFDGAGERGAASAAARPLPAGDEWRADALPETNMSRFIEASVRAKLAALGHAEVAPTVTIRSVSHVDCSMHVSRTVRTHFCQKDGSELPERVPYVSKCLLMFQRIDGVDVCQFSLYVQEFLAAAGTGASPSERRVYIAYLDSVEYFRPRTARTSVYQEILLGYLAWVKARGFTHAHIWACPPQRGNNFIFWCHPSHQRTPSRDRLIEWYRSLFVQAQQLGVVSEVRQLHDVHFKRLGPETGVPDGAAQKGRGGKGKGRGRGGKPSAAAADAAGAPAGRKRKRGAGEEAPGGAPEQAADGRPACPPLFDGDYWIEEVARLNAVLQRRKETAKRQSPMALMRSVIRKLMDKPAGGGFFNQPVDPVALNIPTYTDIIKDPMDLGTVGMKLEGLKYATLLDVVKDIRLVFANAKLFNPPGHAVHEAAAVLEELLERELRAIVQKLEPHLEPEEQEGVLASVSLEDSPNERAHGTRHESTATSGSKLWVLAQLSRSTMRLRNDMFELNLCNGVAAPAQEDAAPAPAGERLACAAASDSEESALNDESDADTSADEGVGVCKRVQGLTADYRARLLAMAPRWMLLGDTCDPDRGVGTPLLNSRHTFLETCQFHHYQFDSLRRAKHSSAMIIYHLRNRDQLDLTPTCSHCAERIRGVRWHCSMCRNLDLCTRCLTDPKAQCGHELAPFRASISSAALVQPSPLRMGCCGGSAARATA